MIKLKKLIPVLLLPVLITSCLTESTKEVPTTPELAESPTFKAPDGPENMIYIPAGEFQMGCDTGNNAGLACLADELPLHAVKLDAFFIDKYEVTNVEYATCVSAGFCSPPSDTKSRTRESYYDDPAFSNYPVIYVNWSKAETYCQWLGKRLPSEAEWEKAAKGVDQNLYPWGEESPNCELANFNDVANSMLCFGDTNEVGGYPEGASYFGVMDMAGNVWEWVNDWYSENFYGGSSYENPINDDGSINKVLRGGGWGDNALSLRTFDRTYELDFNSSYNVGFRCAADISD